MVLVAQVLKWDPAVPGAVQTQNKKTVTDPKSLHSNYKTKDNRWVWTDGGEYKKTMR